MKHSSLLHLDTAAQKTIVQERNATHLQSLNQLVDVQGVGGPQFTVKKKGLLLGHLDCLVTNETQANLLSFKDAERIGKLTYKPPTALEDSNFTLQLPDRAIKFKSHNKVFIFDMNKGKTPNLRSAFATSVEDNAQGLTAAQIKRADGVWQWCQNAAFASKAANVFFDTSASS